jgi:hypothetical protein
MNEPAFPQSTPIENQLHPNYGKDRGMALRDYFAAKAMQGMLAACTGWSDANQDRLASTSYRMADEMLKAREA